MNNLKSWNTIPPQRPQYFFAYLAKAFPNFARKKQDWKNKAKRNAEVVNLTEKMEMCIPDQSRDRALEAKELGMILDHFLRTLAPEDQMVFLRRYWYVDTIAEIATRYGISEGAVQMRLNRTRVKLCTCLKKGSHQLMNGKDILLGLKYVGDDLIENSEHFLLKYKKKDYFQTSTRYVSQTINAEPILCEGTAHGRDKRGFSMDLLPGLRRKNANQGV